jgi:hypothetical protein
MVVISAVSCRFYQKELKCPAEGSMYRKKERHSLIVCLASVLELDQPVQAVAEKRRNGQRWDYSCFRTIEQWKITPARGRGCVFGHNTGFRWSFYDTFSCTHIEVSRREGVYTVWDYAGIDPVEVTFLQRTATVHEPASGIRTQYDVEVRR